MRLSVVPAFVVMMMTQTLIADTVETQGGDRGRLLVVALVGLGLVVAAVKRRGDEPDDEAGDAIDRIEVSTDDERAHADTGASDIDRVGNDERADGDGDDDEQEETASGEADADGEEEDERDRDDDEDVTVEVTDRVSRFSDVDAVDWVMVLAAGVRAMREELDARRGD